MLVVRVCVLVAGLCVLVFEEIVGHRGCGAHGQTDLDHGAVQGASVVAESARHVASVAELHEADSAVRARQVLYGERRGVLACHRLLGGGGSTGGRGDVAAAEQLHDGLLRAVERHIVQRHAERRVQAELLGLGDEQVFGAAAGAER